MQGKDWGADIVLGVLDLARAPGTAGAAMLDELETERLAGMSGPIRPREFLGGRFLLRSMAARLLGIEARAVRIEVEEKGRPRIAAPEALSVGLTHTRDYAACALSRARVGLDLEEIGRKGGLKGVEDIAFSPEESSSLAGLAGPDRERRFFSIWTLKEAYLKRLGLGVPEVERAPSFELGPDGSVLASGGESCGYLCFALGELAIGALAYDLPPGGGKDGRVRVVLDPRFAPPPGLEPRTLYGSGVIAVGR
jgi:4'-phosphopantetheinyl transferase EntD